MEDLCKLKDELELFMKLLVKGNDTATDAQEMGLIYLRVSWLLDSIALRTMSSQKKKNNNRSQCTIGKVFQEEEKEW
jgi:hypothetical protein